MTKKPFERSGIVELDKRFLWHPYTPMAEYIAGVEPLVIERAEGVRLYDMNGRSYIDANASWWCATLGHRPPRVVAALCEQAQQLCHCSLAGITHEPAAALAAELVDVAQPGLERVFFSDNGSTAVEVALKLSLQYWAQAGRPGRRRFVALEAGYHGDTLGASAIGGIEVFRGSFADPLLDCVRVPPAWSGLDPAISALERVVRDGRDEIAAVVVEPVLQGAAGMRLYDPAYLRAAREITERYDVFLIADEVFTGYGRTGPMWACEHARISPDLLCTSKGFTAGLLPMAATLVSPRVFQGFLGGKERAFYYGHTYCGNPLGAAVAREVLRVYRDERVLEGIAPKAARIERAFAELRELPHVVATRALGMMGAADLKGGEGYFQSSGWRVYEEALKRGAYLRPLGNTVYITPALNIPDGELELLLQIVRESVQAVAL